VAPERVLAFARQARDPASIRGAAHAILSEPQFRTPGQSPIDRARHWVGREVSRAIDSALTGHLGLVGGAVLVLIVALIAWLVVRGIRDARGAGTVRGPAVAAIRRPPADWLAEAASCEARGEWRASLRARYRALVAELARRGLVDEIPGRTTGEYRAEVAANLPGAAGAFGGATELFELAVYGHGDAGPKESSELRTLAERVLEGAR
jgi:hypothetical protein